MDIVTSADVIARWPAFANLASTVQAALISDASQAIVDYCSCEFTSSTKTDVHSGRNLSRIWLKSLPVVSVTSVTVNGQAIDNTDGDGWQINTLTGELVRGSGLCDQRFAPWFPAGTNNITVVYVAGYTATPDPVKRACIMAMRFIHESSKISGRYSSERIGDYSYQLDSTPTDILPDSAIRMLDPYVVDPTG